MRAVNRQLRPVLPSPGVRGPGADVKGQILRRIRRDRTHKVWMPNDFCDLGTRSAVDKALQRLANAGTLRRIDRGLYDLPWINSLTGKAAVPAASAVIDAVARRDNARLLVDGITAANDIGLTNAVPGKVVLHTDARLRPIQLGGLTVQFKVTAPSRLYWAGRPAMRVVQALHWVKDLIPEDPDSFITRIRRILDDPKFGNAIRRDLQTGLSTMPDWMKQFVGIILQDPNGSAV